MASAAVAVHRWANAGMVNRTGPRGEVIVNHYAEEARHVDRERTAIARGWPGAIEIGGAPIHASGWTTQIPRVVDIAVPGKGYSEPAAGGVLRHHRPEAWYVAVQPGITGKESLPTLTPAWALADAVLDTRLWAPYPDELYADEASKRSRREFVRAAKAIAAARRFGVADALAGLDVAADMDDLYEQVWHARTQQAPLTSSRNTTCGPAPGG